MNEKEDRTENLGALFGSSDFMWGCFELSSGDQLAGCTTLNRKVLATILLNPACSVANEHNFHSKGQRDV